MKNPQDKELLFKNLYESYSPKIKRLCLGYTGNSVEADDLLQEVFIKAWQNFDSFRGEAQLSTWIYRIAVNTCLYHLRSQKNRKHANIDVSTIKKEEETDNKEQQIQLLYTCISQLSEADRLIITLLLEEVPYSEIAAVTEISEGNLRVKIHRIKQQLSSIYEKYERL